MGERSGDSEVIRASGRQLVMSGLGSMVNEMHEICRIQREFWQILTDSAGYFWVKIDCFQSVSRFESSFFIFLPRTVDFGPGECLLGSWLRGYSDVKERAGEGVERINRRESVIRVRRLVSAKIACDPP
jgi:hypothetical protein